MKPLLLLLMFGAPASARPVHGSVSVGGSLLATGQDTGSRLRGDAEIDVEPSRYGGLVALRAFDKDHRGLLCAGLVYEGAAARPQLVLALHADLGIDLDVRRPVLGGGIRSTLVVAGPLAVVYDGGAYVVAHGVEHSRLVLTSAVMLAAAW